MADSGQSYEEALNGRFSGILTWADFDALWARLRAAPEGWFVYRPDGGVPAQPANPVELEQALADTEKMFTHARSRSWCGAVYVDDPAAPGFVKVFDPGAMAACGGGGTPPQLILCRMKPERSPAPRAAKRGGLLGRLSGGG